MRILAEDGTGCLAYAWHPLFFQLLPAVLVIWDERTGCLRIKPELLWACAGADSMVDEAPSYCRLGS